MARKSAFHLVTRIPRDQRLKMPSMPLLPTVKGAHRMPAFPAFATLTPTTAPIETRRVITGSADQGAAPQPAWWTGSDVEWLTYWWLSGHGIQFEYLANVGLFGDFVGAEFPKQADFLINGLGVPRVFEVQGDYWHYHTTALRNAALARKATYLSRGYQIIYLRGSDLLEALGSTMEAAMQGQQTFPD